MNGRLLLLLRCCFAVTFCLLGFCVNAQNVADSIPDTLSFSDTLSLPDDSLRVENDTIQRDSSQNKGGRSKSLSKGAVEKTVTYDAKDSIVVDIKNRMAYLFGDAVVY